MHFVMTRLDPGTEYSLRVLPSCEAEPCGAGPPPLVARCLSRVAKISHIVTRTVIFHIDAVIFHVDNVIFHIDTVIFHVDTVIFHIGTVILTASSISILASCHLVDRQSKKELLLPRADGNEREC